MTAAIVVNHLVENLPARERSWFLRHCEPVDLVFGSTLCEPETVMRSVYFPLTAFISLVAAVGIHKPMEMGLIGSEGMLGVTLALGVNTAPLRGVVQGSGTALKLSAVKFRRELHANPILARTFGRYIYVLMSQLSNAAACSRFHEVEARLARWLLMIHDRAHGDHFHLTHSFLAEMLGVQRSAVTIAAGALQRGNIIRYSRGSITILDRAALEGASCECYAALIDDYARGPE